jgi:hypothetical protein
MLAEFAALKRTIRPPIDHRRKVRPRPWRGRWCARSATTARRQQSPQVMRLLDRLGL